MTSTWLTHITDGSPVPTFCAHPVEDGRGGTVHCNGVPRIRLDDYTGRCGRHLVGHLPPLVVGQTYDAGDIEAMVGGEEMCRDCGLAHADPAKCGGER